MTNTNIQLHYLQTEILKKLALTPTLKFNELIIEGLESEHMNYHLKKLIEDGFVEKSGASYSLTDRGKDYSNQMDDEIKALEKQPKTSVLIRGVRVREGTNEIEHLLSKRLRQPYYGKVGRLTGKVRFGETLVEAVKRELLEETGLTARTFVLEEIYHKIRYRENGEFVQDVIFYIFFVTDFEGKMIKKLPSQENFWLTKREVFDSDKYDPYDDLVLDDRLNPHKLTLEEHSNLADGF